MSEPTFSLHFNFEVENLTENEDLNNKTTLTDQEIDSFVEEQRKPRTVKKRIRMSASLSSSFKNHLVQRKEV